MSRRKQRKKDRVPSPDALFGELRAVLQNPDITDGQRIHLWGLCVRMFKHHPDTFIAQWRPYLESYASHWRPDLLDLKSEQEFTRAAKMLPDVRFSLTIYKNTFDWANQSHVDTSDLMAGTHLRAVGKLTLHHHLSVLRQKHLDELEELEVITYEHTVVDALLATSEAPCRDRLRTLRVRALAERVQVNLDKLARISRFARLEELSLSRCTLTSYGLEKLVVSGMLDGLVRLDLSDTHIQEEALAHLIRGEILESLTHLTLDELQNTSCDARALCELLVSPLFTRLTHLSLVKTFDTADAARAIMEAITTRHEHLEALDLSWNRSVAICLTMLADSDLFTLRTLHLRDCFVSSDMIELLARHPYFSRLNELVISAYRLSPEHTDLLAESRTLKPHVAARFIR